MLAIAITAELNGQADAIDHPLTNTNISQRDGFATRRHRADAFLLHLQSTMHIVSRGSPELGVRQSLQVTPISSGAAKTVRCANIYATSKTLHQLIHSQREHSANITDTPKAYSQQSPAKAKNILTLDCRGLEFVEFKADGAWKATGVESGTKFADIDLTEGEWFDYDEKAGEEVSIKEVKWEIRRA
ncbi:hypothetical protein LTR82_010597 [Friedmanniomyces endolithicus]|uniref:Uncharacterized protein n=1 Tax=Friedmanniomyces endolithicus TaxID=329885 RepID=A0AAN6J6X5_9PEZI|nr:hypothetical protein LTR82_010597 [Friedmanniomyces endolithicus]